MSQKCFDLREAKDNELDDLIEKSREYLPHSLTVHSLLLVGFRRHMVDKNVTKIYIPVNETFPFFIIITGVMTKPGRNNLTPFWNPKEVATFEAKELMRSLPDWDWNDPVVFNAVSQITLDEITEIMLGHEGLCSKKIKHLKNEGYAFKLEDENSLNFNIPKDVILAPLYENDASLIFENWVYPYNDTLEGIIMYMKHLPSMAAFVRIDEAASNDEDSSDNFRNNYKPVSWALCRHYGEIGFTHTLPEYRNRGLSGAVTLALAKKLIDIGISPFVNICGYNPAAIKSHEKIGFKKYCPVAYHIYLPENMDLDDY